RGGTRHLGRRRARAVAVRTGAGPAPVARLGELRRRLRPDFGNGPPLGRLARTPRPLRRAGGAAGRSTPPGWRGTAHRRAYRDRYPECPRPGPSERGDPDGT